MFHRIFNQWPRIVLVGVLLSLWLQARFGLNPFWLLSEDISPSFLVVVLVAQICLSLVVALAVSAVCVGLIAILVPGLLTLTEFCTLGLVLFALLRPALRPILADLGAPRELADLAIIGLMVLSSELLNGRLSRFLPKVSFGPRRASFVTGLSPEEVWPQIVPAPETIARFYQPDAMTMPAPEGSDAAFILCTPRRFGYPDGASLVRFPFRDAPRHVVIRCEAVHNNDKVMVEELEYTITPTGKGSRITLSIRFERITPGVWLALRLYSIHRDLAMCLRARLEGSRDYSMLGREIRKREAQPKADMPRPAQA